MFKIYVIVLLWVASLIAQMNPYITRYEIDIFRINDGYAVPNQTIVNEGDFLSFNFLHDPEATEPYQSFYTRFKWMTDTIKANKLIWDKDTATYTGIVTYPSGDFELTVRAVVDTMDTLLFSESVNAFYIQVDISDVSLPVFISFFESSIINSIVSLTWVTESEINNLGFNVYRNQSGTSQIKLNDELIEGALNSSQQTSYSLYDNTVIPGETYIYQLESISYKGEHQIQGETVINVPSIPEISLSQNYPNPFNNNTTVKYSVDEISKVSLILYDLNGRMFTVRDEILEAGRYKTVINSNRMASGTYLYFLRAHNIRTRTIQILSKKMILIK